MRPFVVFQAEGGGKRFVASLAFKLSPLVGRLQQVSFQVAGFDEPFFTYLTFMRPLMCQRVNFQIPRMNKLYKAHFAFKRLLAIMLHQVMLPSICHRKLFMTNATFKSLLSAERQAMFGQAG